MSLVGSNRPLGRWRAPLGTCFRIYCALVLLGSGLAKLVSLGGHSATLSQRDYLLYLTNTTIYAVAGTVEVVAVIAMAICSTNRTRAWIVLALAANFLGYRLAAIMAGAPAPCPCMGRATEWWPWLARNQGWLTVFLSSTMLMGALAILAGRAAPASSEAQAR